MFVAGDNALGRILAERRAREAEASRELGERSEETARRMAAIVAKIERTNRIYRERLLGTKGEPKK